MIEIIEMVEKHNTFITINGTAPPGPFSGGGKVLERVTAREWRCAGPLYLNAKKATRGE